MTTTTTRTDISSRPSSMLRHRGFVVPVDRSCRSFRFSWKSLERAVPIAAYVAFFVGASALFLTSGLPTL